MQWAIISTHVPRAGHDPLGFLGIVVETISTHVPRAGHDETSRVTDLVAQPFQPTCPVRGTTDHAAAHAADDGFQPTCPVRGTTQGWPEACSCRRYFNPRAPCGARRVYAPDHPCRDKFQPTCPVRGTTAKMHK